MSNLSYREIFPSSFISANSKNGFYSLYDEVFDACNFDRIYVLFGGPGTGKSTFLRELAQKAEKRSIAVEEILCSSDPSSLDGVLMTKDGVRIGVLDGTPPHGRIITSPAISEELIDLGAFWDTNKISENKNTIYALKDKKRENYESAYRYLLAAGTLWEEFTEAKKKYFDKEKAKRQILHKLHALKERGVCQRRFLRSFSTCGNVVLPVRDEGVQNILLIRGSMCTAEIYLSYFEELLQQNEIAHTVFLSPLSPNAVDAIFFSENKTLLIKEDLFGGKTSHRRIVADRFFSWLPEDKKEHKHIFEETLSLALSSLKQAGAAHAAMEKYYIDGMDFSSLGAYREASIEKILSEFPV